MAVILRIDCSLLEFNTIFCCFAAMDSLLTPALEVNQALLLSGGVTSPRDGEEFLANVVLERLSCQEVVSAPLLSYQNKQNVFATEPLKTASAHESLLPTIEWQNYQVADFSQIRTRVSRIRNKKPIWRHPVKLPTIDTQESIHLWQNFVAINEPTLSLIFTIKQSALEFIIEVLIDSLRETPIGKGINPMHGKWLFAALASLKLPLQPDVHSSLRDLARICSQIRSRIPLDDENITKEIAPLNLFICLIAKYFGQGDLAD